MLGNAYHCSRHYVQAQRCQQKSETFNAFSPRRKILQASNSTRRVVFSMGGGSVIKTI